MSERQSTAAKYIFTVTAGRTGTAWLADFLSANLKVPTIHEPLEIDDFGTRMPDIKIMRSFNDRGNDELVRNFWKGKLAEIARQESYAETNHTLAKCGLVENLAGSEIAKDSVLVVLRRNRIDQCLSYLARGDFLNITIDWQWYLSPNYQNNIINPEIFFKYGQMGRALWYVYEMDVRQHYYIRQYGDALNFIEVDLEQVTQPPQAKAFLEAIGVSTPVVMPERRNQNAQQLSGEIADSVAAIVNSINYDPEALVSHYLAEGRELGQLR